jgi:comEA protein
MDTTGTFTNTLRTFRRLAVAMAALAALALAAPAHAAPGRQASAASPSHDESDGASGVVNLNTATEAELQLLPGVGPAKAAAVLAYRKKYGAFKKVEDLGKVKGFSYKTLKKLKPYLALSGTTTYKGKAKKGPNMPTPQTEGAEP